LASRSDLVQAQALALHPAALRALHLRPYAGRRTRATTSTPGTTRCVEAEVICYDEACREQMLASVISVREPVVPR
jgi:hypothetical protein